MILRYGYPVANRILVKFDAIALAALIESEMARGAFIDRTMAGNATFRDLITRYGRGIMASNALSKRLGRAGYGKVPVHRK